MVSELVRCPYMCIQSAYMQMVSKDDVSHACGFTVFQCVCAAVQPWDGSRLLIHTTCRKLTDSCLARHQVRLLAGLASLGRVPLISLAMYGGS